MPGSFRAYTVQHKHMSNIGFIYFTRTVQQIYVKSLWNAGVTVQLIQIYANYIKLIDECIFFYTRQLYCYNIYAYTHIFN